MALGRRKVPALLVIATVLSALLGSATDAHAADLTPPQLSLVKKPAFVVGSIIGTSAFRPGNYYSRFKARLSWHATDPSGICGYSLVEEWGGGPPNTIFEDQPITRYDVHITDYDGSFGGGSGLTYYWIVSAKDCAGNTTSKTVTAGSIGVLQDNGTTESDRRGRLTYSGAWSSSRCTCWSALTTRKTTTKGAAATYTANFSAGDHAALVMAKGPDRGRAAVYVDGKFRQTINTYSRQRQHRVVVWDSWMANGIHSVKVVNLATAGHPRIDLDAVATS